MPVRLCYSPKAYVYTKNSAGIVTDISDYVTSGEVQRLINQASSASITLRNPNRIFTKPKQPTFHPMDAITIYLERIKGYPVQVFTGYLDETPYYQMFPGTVTLEATCTIKRLMYTYFDPSLPYVNSFFAYYGWIADQQGAIYNLPAAGNAKRVTVSQAASGSVNLEDGSIGKLLYATLSDIGNWDDSHIYIEDIPSGAEGLGARIGALMQNLLVQEQTAAQELTTFLDGTIGSSSQGSGGGSGSTGSLTGSNNAEKAYNYLNPLVGDYGASGIVGNMMWESGGGSDIALANGAPNSGGGWGIIQWTPKPSSLPEGASLEKQLAYVKQELTGAYADVAAQLQKATSPSNAADIYCHGREEPQVPLLGDESVVNWTQREKNAELVYSSYHNNSGNSVNSGTGTGATTNTTGPRGTTVAGGSVTFADPNTTTSGTVKTGDSTTVYNAIVEAANAVNAKNYPYAYGGGHGTLGVASSGTSTEDGGPEVTGFDCSGAVSAVLGAAQLLSSPDVAADIEGAISQYTSPGVATGDGTVTIFANSGHTFMKIGNRYWGTSDGNMGNPDQTNGGAGWLPSATGGESYLSTFTAVHIKQAVLNQSCKYSLGLTGGGTIPGTSGSGTSASSITNTASAEAFTAELDFPSIQDMSLAIMLGATGNGLMHDQQLLPFIQQLTNASMRSFQSLPNGDFYAFFPDYFGEFDQHPAYWEVDDLEILSGDIYLNDSSLVTHQYVVGDNTWPADSGMYNELFSTGVITIYNAFQQGMGINGQGNMAETQNTTVKGQEDGGMADVMDQNEAIEFVKRYGARPQVSTYPQVRSSLYEMFLAYQEFMVAWANQFRTTFSFTFMPEVYPGGKISFPNHGIQLYVQSVTHTFDYTEGFTTNAVLTAPSSLGTNPDIPAHMVQAMVKPVRDAAAADTTKPSGGSTSSSKAAASSASSNYHHNL